MTRFYGRAKGKKRVYDYVPAKRIKRTTLLSSVRLDGTIVKKVFQGALNGKIFLDYIKNTLVPTLHKGDIVVMDNLSCHKVKGVKEAIESVKASVLYLPPYSPDFNPIEMMWSKIKSLLRKWKARTSDMLDFFLLKAFSSVTTENIQHWFSECGVNLKWNCCKDSQFDTDSMKVYHMGKELLTGKKYKSTNNCFMNFKIF